MVWCRETEVKEMSEGVQDSRDRAEEEGENTRNRAGLTKVMQCRCGGKRKILSADAGSTKVYWDWVDLW